MQVKFAALWASLVLVYIYVDMLSLYQPGVIDDIRGGRVWQLDITQTWAVGALALMAMPILMVALCLMLPARQDVFDELDRGLLVARVADAQHPQPGAIIGRGELVVLASGAGSGSTNWDTIWPHPTMVCHV